MRRTPWLALVVVYGLAFAGGLLTIAVVTVVGIIVCVARVAVWSASRTQGTR
jgi:hypothetical protein